MLKDRFRKFLPVVVDLETGGFDPKKNAILEIAIQLIDEDNSKLILGDSHRYHINPFNGLIVNKDALEFLKLDLNGIGMSRTHQGHFYHFGSKATKNREEHKEDEETFKESEIEAYNTFQYKWGFVPRQEVLDSLP